MAEVPMQKPLKYSITHYHQPQRTHDDSIKWLVEKHLPLAIPVLKQHGVLGYSLFVTPPFLSNALRPETAKLQPTWDIADFDCFIEYTIPDMQAMKNVVSDPEWAVATKDQDQWVDMSKSLVSLGYSTPYLLETGEVVNLQK